MKHFIIRITYTAPIEKIDEILSEHRKFLQEGYDKSIILFSGPMNPRTGGIIVVRGKSVEEIKALISRDPYKINNAGDYEIIEFNPVKHQEFLIEWVNG